MTVLPIIERELRARARSRGTYWGRFAVALVGMLFCLPQLVAPAAFGTAGSPGKWVFNGIVWAGFVLCCSGCVLTADAVSSERREGTLGLLLLTRVNRFDVLLGKLGSVGLASVAVLVVLLPMLMLPVLAGGVLAGEALRKGAGLLNALFFALAAGLFASTLTKERHKAVGWALGLVVATVIVPLVLAANVRAPSSASVFALMSPLFLITWGPSQSFSSWLISLMLVQALAWLLLISAGLGLRRAMREEGSATVSPGSSRARAGMVRRRCQPLEADASAIEWLVWRQPGLSAAIWTAVGVTVLYQLLNYWLYRRAGGSSLLGYGAVMLPSLAVTLFNGVLLAWAVSRFFIQARQSGELELLLTTTVGAEAIISGQWRALKRLLRWPVAVVLAVMILRMLWNPAFQPGGLGGWNAYYACSTLVGVVWVLLEIAAVCWTGMWFGLQARRPAGAIAWTVGLTRGVPFLVNIVGQVIIAVLVSMTVLRVFGSARFFWMLPSVAILFYYLWLIRRSKRRLFQRLAGAEPVGPGLGQRIVGAVRKARHWTPG